MIGVQDTPIISYLTRNRIDRGGQEYDVFLVILKRPKNEFFEPWDIKR